MGLSKSKPYSAMVIDEEFGIVDILIEDDDDDGKTLIGRFIKNENDDAEILDQFTIVKE